MNGYLLLALRLALSLALYAFLFWAFWSLWKDLHKEARLLNKPQIPPLTLSQQQGEAIHSFRFNTPEVTLGRDTASDCHLEDKTISAQHARLSYHHRQWWVEDLHSTNGTYLNHEPVQEPLVLTDGDELRVGGLIFAVHLAETSLPVPESSV